MVGTVAAHDCEWMFGDAATGALGFHAMAGLNPLRWSGSLTFQQGIEQLREAQQKGERPIVLKVPSGVLNRNEVNYPTTQSAIDYLSSLIGGSVVAAPVSSVVMVQQVGGLVQTPQTVEEAVAAREEDVEEAVVGGTGFAGTYAGVPLGSGSPYKRNFIEKVVDVQHTKEHVIEVEVAEKTFHRVIKHQPVLREREIEMIVEVPEIHTRAELNVKEEWRTETVSYEVPRVTICEEINLVSEQIREDYQEIVEVEVLVPVGERIVERPNVVVEEKIIYTTGRDMIVDTTEEIVEVQHVVQVPRIVAVPKIERRTEVKEFSVPNIQQNVNVTMVDELQTVPKTVVVPQVHTTRNIRYIPKFTCPEQDASRDITTDFVFELEEANAYIAKLEREKGDLRTRLGQSLIDLSAKKQQVEAERMINFTLEEKIKSALIMSGEVGVMTAGMRSKAPAGGSSIFDMIDRNHDGVITREEFQSVFGK